MNDIIFARSSKHIEGMNDFVMPFRRARIFNTPFENMLRILELLTTISPPLNVDRLIAYDFLSIYGKQWGVLDKNLHGDNHFSFAEFRQKRFIMKKALSLGVKYCLIEIVPSSKGILYQASARGRAVINQIDSPYAAEYKDFVSLIEKRFRSLSDEELLAFIKHGAGDTELSEYAELLD